MAEPTYEAIASEYNKAPTSAKTMTALGFTSGQIDLCEAVVFSVTTAAMSITMDGSTPSATNGIQYPPTVAPVWIFGRENVRNLQFFSSTGILNISLMGRI